MHNEQKENQAIKLQQLFAEVTNQRETHLTEDHKEDLLNSLVEVDVLQLPPRSEVHKGRKWGIHFRFNAPLFRFVLVMIILIGIGFLLYMFYGEEIIEFFIT